MSINLYHIRAPRALRTGSSIYLRFSDEIDGFSPHPFSFFLKVPAVFNIPHGDDPLKGISAEKAEAPGADICSH